MNPKLKNLMERAESWPDAVQEEAACMLLEIEERAHGPYRLSNEEWAALREGLAQAERGECVSEEIVAEADKRHGA